MTHDDNVECNEKELPTAKGNQSVTYRTKIDALGMRKSDSATNLQLWARLDQYIPYQIKSAALETVMLRFNSVTII